MAQTEPTPTGEHVPIIRGAEDQLTALERLWAQGTEIDLQDDEAAWLTLRRALDESRREIGARPLFPREEH